MADVQIQQEGPRRSGGNVAWALIVLVLIGIIAWFFLAGGMGGGGDRGTDIEVNVPGAGGGTGGGTGGGGTGGGGTTTTP